MKDLALSWRTYCHNRTLRDHRLVAGILLLLTTFLLSLSLISQSIQDHLESNMQSMLGSDMVLVRFASLTGAQNSELSELSTKLSQTRLLDINMSNEGQWQRVQLKVVDDSYPVQGSLGLARQNGGALESRDRGPDEGELWVGSRLFTQLGLRMGQTVDVGGVPLELTAIVQHEPDRLMEGHSVKLRALVHERSFASSGLPANGARHRTLLSADETQRVAIARWVGEELGDARLLDRHSGGHPLAGYWKRVENFFGLSSVLLFLMAAIAINMATRRQLALQEQRFALYLSMGVSPARGLRLAFFEWLMAFVAGALPAVVLAYGVQLLLISEMQAQFPGLEAGWHIAAMARVLLLVLLLFLCLQVPVFLALYRTSAMTLIRQQQRRSRALVPLAWNLLTLMLLTATYSDNWLLTGLVLAAMLAAVLLMLVLTLLVLWSGERIGRDRAGLWSFAFFVMKNRVFSKATQVMGLGLCATLLLFTLMLMRDIGDSMFSHTRTQNGNLVVSEALEQQLPGIQEWADETGSVIKDMKPFQRALLSAINGRSPGDHAGHPSETLDVVQQPIRLSWSEQLPDNNRVTDGSWWTTTEANWQQISVEKEVMVDLELRLGDVLSFDVAGRDFEFTIVASHAVRPGRSAVTFWFMTPASILPELPGPLRAMGSMELPDQAWPRLVELLRRYPALAVVSLQELTERFDATLAIVTRLTLVYSSMILLMSVAVLLASIIGFEAEDRRRNGLLKSLGLSDRKCLRIALYEWLFTGLVAAAGALVGTWVAGHFIYRSQFQLSYQPDALWILATLSFSCALVCALGVWFSRSGLRAPVRQLLAS